MDIELTAHCQAGCLARRATITTATVILGGIHFFYQLLHCLRLISEMFAVCLLPVFRSISYPFMAAGR